MVQGLETEIGLIYGLCLKFLIDTPVGCKVYSLIREHLCSHLLQPVTGLYPLIFNSPKP